MTPSFSKIETLAIGDELLVGKIADTNSQFVGRQLFNLGLRLSRETVVADEISEIIAGLKESAGRSKAVIVFGGLGPTSDDRTAESVAKLLDCKLVEDVPSKVRLFSVLKKRGRDVTPVILKQVLYPEATKTIPNLKGLAIGFYFTMGNCTLFFLPGVPMEMEAMFQESVLPELKNIFQCSKLWSHTWRCLGLHESQVQEAMNPVEKRLPEGCYLGYRTFFPENHLTLYWSEERKKEGFESEKIRIGEILKTWVYTEEDKELEQVVVEELSRQKKKIALAESCTGGLTLQRLTRVPGASDVIWGGYTTYQITAKERMLGVKLQNMDEGVSQQCSTQLARQVKAVSECDISAAVTGYMGPTAGEKDFVGTAYLSVFGKNLIEKKIVVPTDDRLRAQWGTSSYLLQALLKVLRE
ncbi:MAG: nicotinamide-nucleotide amidohydrolase family protein [Deltaproteobacteria bacterium]|nr:nicotinamide-nucleotide amidohydrolase family protein [Deltaproteobacteria bacterium]